MKTIDLSYKNKNINFLFSYITQALDEKINCFSDVAGSIRAIYGRLRRILTNSKNFIDVAEEQQSLDAFIMNLPYVLRLMLHGESRFFYASCENKEFIPDEKEKANALISEIFQLMEQDRLIKSKQLTTILTIENLELLTLILAASFDKNKLFLWTDLHNQYQILNLTHEKRIVITIYNTLSTFEDELEICIKKIPSGNPETKNTLSNALIYVKEKKERIESSLKQASDLEIACIYPDGALNLDACNLYKKELDYCHEQLQNTAATIKKTAESLERDNPAIAQKLLNIGNELHQEIDKVNDEMDALKKAVLIRLKSLGRVDSAFALFLDNISGVLRNMAELKVNGAYTLDENQRSYTYGLIGRLHQHQKEMQKATTPEDIKQVAQNYADSIKYYLGHNCIDALNETTHSGMIKHIKHIQQGLEFYAQARPITGAPVDSLASGVDIIAMGQVARPQSLPSILELETNPSEAGSMAPGEENTASYHEEQKSFKKALFDKKDRETTPVTDNKINYIHASNGFKQQIKSLARLVFKENYRDILVKVFNNTSLELFDELVSFIGKLPKNSMDIKEADLNALSSLKEDIVNYDKSNLSDDEVDSLELILDKLELAFHNESTKNPPHYSIIR